MIVTSVARMGNEKEILLTFDQSITADELQKIHDLLSRKEPHCKTCQCARVEAEMPTHPAHPEIKRGKSWHHG